MAAPGVLALEEKQTYKGEMHQMINEKIRLNLCMKQINSAKPVMYLMSGLSGAGKTKFAKDFAKKRGLRYLCPDDFYAVVNGDDRIHEHEFEVWMAFFQAVRLAEQDGVSCIIDTNALTVVHRTQFLDWFPGFDHVLIYISASLELCQQNNKNRRRVIPEGELLRMHHRLQVPTKDEDPRWGDLIMLRNNNNESFELVSDSALSKASEMLMQGIVAGLKKTVVHPCQIGDTMYGVRCVNGVHTIVSGEVVKLIYTKDGVEIVVMNFGKGCLGKNLFHTFEDAAAAVDKVNKCLL